MMGEIRKAVITTAGWGTRFLPLTKSQPKEMLPLVDKPVVQYAVEEAMNAGLAEIIVITGESQHLVEDFFSHSRELEEFVKQRGQWNLLEKVCQIVDNAEICYVRQKYPLGLGHAVLTTKEAIGEEAFAVLLPDEVFEKPLLGEMISLFERLGSSVIAVQRIGKEEIERYGIIQPRKIGEGLYEVLDLVEKPSPEEAPSDLGIVGRYILTPEIFSVLEVTPPGKNSEIQLTDGLRLLLQRQPIYAYEYQGVRYDVGVPLGWLKSLTLLSLSHPELGAPFREFLKGLKL